jgi:tetratricopeptide (TPR) repeat protein
LGDYEQCSRLLEESLSFQQAVGSKIRTAECHEALGKNESAQGSHTRAEACFSQQAEVLRDLGNRELLSLSLSQLGGAVLAQGRTDDAVVLLAAALATAEACGDTPAIALAHKEHGYLALQRGDDEVAAQHWRLALTLASGTPDRQHLLVMLDALLGLTMLMARTGDTERAVETASLVQQAARIDRYTQTRAETMLAELAGRLPQDRLTRGVEHGKALEFGATVTALLA